LFSGFVAGPAKTTCVNHDCLGILHRACTGGWSTTLCGRRITSTMLTPSTWGTGQCYAAWSKYKSMRSCFLPCCSLQSSSTDYEHAACLLPCSCFNRPSHNFKQGEYVCQGLGDRTRWVHTGRAQGVSVWGTVHQSMECLWPWLVCFLLDTLPVAGVC
jgi:hypothetical protein